METGGIRYDAPFEKLIRQLLPLSCSASMRAMIKSWFVVNFWEYDFRGHFWTVDQKNPQKLQNSHFQFMKSSEVNQCSEETLKNVGTVMLSRRFCSNFIQSKISWTIVFHHHADLVVPRTRLQLGNRAFCVAGSVDWNSLPLHIRSAPTLSTFKNMRLRVRTANIVRRPCSDSSHVTVPYKLLFYYYQSLLSTAVLHSTSYYMQRHIFRLVLEKVFTWCCVYSELVLCEEVLYQSRKQVAPVEDVVSLRNVFVIIFVVSVCFVIDI